MAYKITLRSDKPIDGKMFYDELLLDVNAAGFYVDNCDIIPRARRGISVVMLELCGVKNIDGPASLTHQQWIDVDELVNDLLDAWRDDYDISADVKTSSYMVRVKGQRRKGYEPGDFHGVNAEWYHGHLEPA